MALPGAAACGSGASSLGAASGFGGDAGGPSDSSTAVDAGTDTSAVENDSGAGPDGAGVDSGTPLATGAEFVHASADLGDLRLCWRVGNANFSDDLPYPSTGTAPASNYPALQVGGAVALADASSLLGGDLTIAAIPADWLYTFEKANGGTLGV